MILVAGLLVKNLAVLGPTANFAVQPAVLQVASSPRKPVFMNPPSLSASGPDSSLKKEKAEGEKIILETNSASNESHVLVRERNMVNERSKIESERSVGRKESLHWATAPRLKDFHAMNSHARSVGNINNYCCPLDVRLTAEKWLQRLTSRSSKWKRGWNRTSLTIRTPLRRWGFYLRSSALWQ